MWPACIFCYLHLDTCFCKSLYLFLSLFSSAVIIRHWRSSSGEGIVFSLSLSYRHSLTHSNRKKKKTQFTTFEKSEKKLTEVKSLSETDQHWLNAGNSSRFAPVTQSVWDCILPYFWQYAVHSMWICCMHGIWLSYYLFQNAVHTQKKVQQCNAIDFTLQF